MTSLKLASYLTYLLLWRLALATNHKLSAPGQQEIRFISANVGDNLTLPCFYKGDAAAMYHWYKQTLGEKPRLMSSFYIHDKDGTFTKEFKNMSRFSLETKDSKNHLKISDLQISDSGTYHCISCSVYKYEFVDGASVSVKGSGMNIKAVVRQSASETIQPGDSVTLNCTVHTGTCDGEHSVYWFRNSAESYPGVIYTQGDRNDQCERKPDTQTQSCMYNLAMKSQNRADAGTYYCAAASCGHMQFRDGAMLDVADEVNYSVYFLSGALAFTTILIALLAFSLYDIIKRHSCQCTDSQAGNSAPSTANEGYQDSDNLHYAALRTKRTRRQREDTLTQCVYSSVKL